MEIKAIKHPRPWMQDRGRNVEKEAPILGGCGMLVFTSTSRSMWVSMGFSQTN
jgi:hypothetical protein